MREHTHDAALPYSVEMLAMVLTARPVSLTMDEHTDDHFENGQYACWDSSLMEPIGFLRKEHTCHVGNNICEK